MSTLAFTVCFAVWTIFSIIGVQIKADLGLNDTEFGLLVATPILTGSLSRIFSASGPTDAAGLYAELPDGRAAPARLEECSSHGPRTAGRAGVEAMPACDARIWRRSGCNLSVAAAIAGR